MGKKTAKTKSITEHRAQGLTCGDCRAGIRLREVKLPNGNRATVVEKCDACLLFETNADAVGAVEVLVDMLDVEYADGGDDDSGTVADAMDRILDLVKGAAEVRQDVRAACGDQGDISDDPIAQAICGVGPVDPPALDGLKAALTEKLAFRCGCEKPCATLEQHECAIRRALGMHRGNCAGCAQRERAVRT